MAATWKGSISFGLVNIPVELHAAVKDSRPHFRMLHASDKSPVHYERVCERDGKTVAWADLVKGYEYSKGKFVVLTKEDFRAAAVEKTKTIDILDFVDPADVDDRFFDTSYYAVPGKGGDRGYALLREAIRESGQIGVGKVVLRDTQHLTALTVVEDALVLTMMRFADELVDVSRFRFPGRKDMRPKELAMAKQLVTSLSEKWHPDKYEDDYRANLMRVIDAKLKGKEPDIEAEETTAPAGVVDLMEKLRQSIEGRTAKTKSETKGRRGPRRAGKASPRRASSKASSRG